MKGGVGKAISLQDKSGSYTVYAGNGRVNGGDGDDKLYGGTGKDTLFGGAGNDKLYGGDGDDTLYGQRGDDELTGGAGKDTFIYYTGYGNETITDYTADDDKIKLVTGSISKTELVNNGTDVKFTIGDGSITVQNGAGKTISLQDSRGSYTVSTSKIVLGSDFKGTLDSGTYLGTITSVNGKSATKALTLNGNGNANTIYGGSGSDYLYGGAGGDSLFGQAGDDHIYGGDGDDTLYGQRGDDELTGGAGKDTFVYYTGYGNETITDYTSGDDKIKLVTGSISQTEVVDGTDVKFTIGDGSITVKGGVGKAISLQDKSGSYTVYAGNGRVNGGDGDDKLYGGTGNDTLAGGAGNDVLVGGAGSDTLTGGSGNDTFVYGSGTDTITDYTNNENETDTVRIEGTTVYNVGSSTSNNSFVVLTSNEGQVWLTDALGKPVRIEDNHGMYTVLYDPSNSTKTITLDDDFAGSSFDASDLTFAKVIDASGMTKNITITGNANSNTMYAGQGGSTLYGGAGSDTLTGGDGNDTLYGDAGGDTLTGGDGDDTLYGGAGGDTLTGGLGNDTFVYDSGIDTITDYTNDENETDTLRIEGTTISDIWESTSTNRVLVNTSNGAQIKLNDAAGKSVRIEDNHGAYTISSISSNPTITIGDDFSDSSSSSFDASEVAFADVKVIDASSMTKNITITGNTKNNIIHTGQGSDILYGGDGNDTLYGGAGNDNLYGGDGDNHLYGGEGNDTFWYESGKYTIHDYEVGNDTIRFVAADVTKSEVLGNDVLLSLSNGGKITVKNMAGQTMNYIDSAGASHSINFGTETVTQQSVIKKFMLSLDDYTTFLKEAEGTNVIDAEGALDTAVTYASNGVFESWNDLIQRFVGAVENYGATTYNASKEFLKSVCGIDLDNLDTGAIIGSDAGGAEKTADSIVPESGTIDPVGTATTSTINGLTLYWERSDEEMQTRMQDQKYLGKDANGNDIIETVPTWWYNGGGDVVQQTAIADRLNTWWAGEGLNLIEESYGLNFEGATVKDIDVRFYNDDKYDSTTLAKVRSTYKNSGSNIGETYELRLQINMKYFNSIDFSNGDNVNGDPGGNSNYYLDRVLAHEFTHAVMAANITGFAYLPDCLKEGLAELVHGIDDVRTSKIKQLGLAAKSNTLLGVLSDMSNNNGVSEDYYAGGYMLMRYFAKQVADYWNEGSASQSNGMLVLSAMDGNASASLPDMPSSVTESNASVMDMASSVTDSIASTLNMASVQAAMLDFADPFISDSLTEMQQEESKNDSLFITGNV